MKIFTDFCLRERIFQITDKFFSDFKQILSVFRIVAYIFQKHLASLIFRNNDQENMVIFHRPVSSSRQSFDTAGIDAPPSISTRHQYRQGKIIDSRVSILLQF